MKYTVSLLALFVAVSAAPAPTFAQEVMFADAPSGTKAFALSLVVPGLGHRYVHGGSWDGWASVFAAADAGLWAGLVGITTHRSHLVESYRTLAAQRAGVGPSGKDRDFYLNVASYLSSEDYVDALLRSRNWDQVEAARDPTAQWEWASEEAFQDYRGAREKSESLLRRRTFIITSLVANRLISGIAALRAARRAEPPRTELSFGMPPAGSDTPLVQLRVRLP